MSSQRSGPGRYNPNQYPWLLTSDPPVCRSGPALAVLRRCERLRRGDRCVCRFGAADIAEDLERAGVPELAEYFATSLEPEDVEDLASKLRRLDPSRLADTDLGDELTRLLHDLGRLVEAGAGLTDRFSDDLD